MNNDQQEWLHLIQQLIKGQYLDTQVPTPQEYLRNRRTRLEFSKISEPTPIELK